jgi:hypothetical protein
MTTTNLIRLSLWAAIVAVPVAMVTAGEDTLGEPVSLCASESYRGVSALQEALAPNPPRIHEVGNWISMSEAQSTLPQGIYAGAELYFAQPRVGDAGTFATGSGFMGSGALIEVQNVTFNFQASPKAYFGWRSANTGDAVQFTYWHFDQSAQNGFTITDSNVAFVPLTNFDEPEPYFGLGDSITSRRSLNFNVYDIDYLKSLAFSGGRWLVTGSVGARIASVNQNVNTVVHLGSGELAGASAKDLTFTGAGPRLTLEGRRNLGPFFALYARGGYSLLYGSLDSTIYADRPLEGDDPIRLIDNRDRTVTVAEIELGASWSVTPNVILSGGYLFQAWTGLNNNIGQSVVIDSQQLTSFNGLVVRGVLSY